MSGKLKLPIKVGTQERYNNIEHHSKIIYVCSDTGNMYLGDTAIGAGQSVTFYAQKEIPSDFGSIGQMCITPYGIYEKSDEGAWSLFSKWQITENGELSIDGKVPIASLDKLGFVRSSDKDGDVAVRDDGTMHVNGWEDIEVSQNYVYRNY